MARTETPVCNFGAPAPDFTLPDTRGVMRSLAACRGERGTLVMFICNHCPYVQAVVDRLVEDCRALERYGVASVAIMPNDIAAYPQDGPQHMAAWASEKRFPFPYLFDETQAVARAYGAVCTPDFFGYNTDLELQYRGRLDASRKEPVPEAPRELLEAMRLVAETGKGPAEQIPSMGCSIKWRDAVA